MMEHTGVTMRGQEHEQGRVEGVSPTEFMGVKIRVKISRGDMSFDRYTLYSLGGYGRGWTGILGVISYLVGAALARVC